MLPSKACTQAVFNGQCENQCCRVGLPDHNSMHCTGKHAGLLLPKCNWLEDMPATLTSTPATSPLSTAQSLRPASEASGHQGCASCRLDCPLAFPDRTAATAAANKHTSRVFILSPSTVTDVQLPEARQTGKTLRHPTRTLAATAP